MFLEMIDIELTFYTERTTFRLSTAMHSNIRCHHTISLGPTPIVDEQ